MRSIVVYSSRTGNTKKVAEAIHSIMPEDCHIEPVENLPDPENYDLLILGFWADRGGPDTKMAKYMKGISSKKVGLFGTLGAYPDSDHAKEFMQNARDLVAENTFIGDFVCQGKVDPKIIERMSQSAEALKRHPMSPERKARIEEAKKHPNEEDLAQAKASFKEFLSRAEA